MNIGLPCFFGLRPLSLIRAVTAACVAGTASFWRSQSCIALLLTLYGTPGLAVNATGQIYTAPYNDHDLHFNVSNSLTVNEAVSKWWEGYKRRWGVQPYGGLDCGYSLTYLPNGEVTGQFASMKLSGDCGGGNGIFGTLKCPKAYTLSGGSCVYNGSEIPDKNRGQDENLCNGTNPINGATGNKFQQEVDYRGVGRLPLRFERYYNSESSIFGVAGTNYSGAVGVRWSSTYERSIKQVSTTAYARRPDGKVVYFVQSGGSWIADPDVVLRLEQTASGWRLRDDADVIESYDASGNLLSLETPQGYRQDLAYASGKLVGVSDSFGRSLQFGYDADGRLQSLTDPAGQAYQYAYDASGNLASVTYPGGGTRLYHYEDSRFAHALTGITDENGDRYATWGYDAQARAISSEHADGVDRVTLTYNADGTTTFTDSLGAIRTSGFTLQQGVKKTAATTQACGTCGTVTASTTYDANGFAASRTDFNGNLTTYIHNARGLETSRTEAASTPQARTITTDWHPVFRLPTQINEPGRRTEYGYDSSGNRLTWTVTDLATNEVRTTTYTYTALGLLDTVDGPRTDVSDVTNYDYDSQGNLTAMTNALGQVTQITSHDAHGNPLTIIDPNGVQTILTYDLRQRLLSRTSAGAVTGFEYDEAGNLTKLTSATGSFLSYGYDDAHRLTDIQDSLGNRIHYTLDDAGNRTQEKVYDPANTLRRQLNQEYDSQSRLKKILGANGQVTQYGYDAQGNRTSETEAGTFITSTQYDALNRLQQVTDAGNGVTTYGYNALDQLISVTDPKGLTTGYAVNAFGEVTTQTSPDTGITAYTYDKAGNRQSQTDARGITVSYGYDALDRITQADYPGATEDVLYLYDGSNYTASLPNGIGRLTGTVDATGQVTYGYDPRGNLSLEERFVTGAGFYTTSYAYDVGSSRVDLQACKLEYSIVSPK